MADDAVEPLLDPYRDHDLDLDLEAEDGIRWDYYTVGGRWTGELTVNDYDPFEDIENMEVCIFCGGTGERATFPLPGHEWEAVGGCNGCFGNGLSMRSKCSTWLPYDGDVAPLSEVDPEFLPAAVVTPDGKWYEREGYDGSPDVSIEVALDNREKRDARWRATVNALYEQHPGATAVLVDCCF